MAATPNVADTDLDSILLELSWALFAISFIVYGLRIFSDLYIIRSFKLTSWIASLSFIPVLASQVFTTLAVHCGIGRHIESLSQEQTEMAMNWIWHTQPLQLLANTTGKFAIAALLVTLHGPKFAKAKTSFVWTLAGLQALFVLLAIAMIYAQCQPVRKLWRSSLPGKCNGRTRNQVFAYVQGGISSTIDLALAIYPIFLFWDLRVKPLKKLMLSVLFAFGIVGSVCASIRTVNVRRLGQTQDITHAFAKLVIWNTTEMYLVILAGSLPGLRPFFNKRLRDPPSPDPSSDKPQRQSRQDAKKHIVLKLSSLPKGRCRAYACTNNDNDNGSMENILSITEYGRIMKTIDVRVGSGRNSEQGPQQGDGSRGADWSDLETGNTGIRGKG